MVNHYEDRFPWNLNWNLLRTFMVVVEQSGITMAANFLGLKQPTVSSALKQLEELVKCKLIERNPHNFKVTPAGQKLYAECSGIFGAISQLPALLYDVKGEIAGHISIVMASHVVSTHLDKILEDFNAQHQKVTYSISILESSEVQNRVINNRASFGICLIENKPKLLEVKTIFREYFSFYCGSKHRLFGRKNINLSELEGEESVSFQTDINNGLLHMVTNLRAQAQMKVEPKGVSSNLREVRRMILANFGIGALPVHIARPDVEAGVLWQLPPYSKLPIINIHLITNPKRSQNAAEEVLLELLNKMIEAFPIKERTYL